MRKKFAPEQKMNAVHDYLSVEKSQGRIADSLGIGKAVLRRWIANYQSMGGARI